MKFKYFSTLCVSLFSVSTLAAATNVYDTDGANRHTTHSLGPVAKLTTANDAARELSVYVYKSDANSICTSGAVYDAMSEQLITSVNIVPAGATPVVDRVSAPIPEEALAKNNVLKLACSDGNGDSYVVHHKLPAVPTVEWNAAVISTGDFIHQNQSYGYHEQINYSGTINVDNHTADAYCYSDADRGVPLYLFHGHSGQGQFHADVFTTDKTMSNDAPVLFQSVTCVNPSGSTRAIRAWELTDENQISLIVNETIIR